MNHNSATVLPPLSLAALHRLPAHIVPGRHANPPSTARARTRASPASALVDSRQSAESYGSCLRRVPPLSDRDSHRRSAATDTPRMRYQMLASSPRAAVLRANRKGTLHIQQQVQQPAVNNAHAFRFTGTAGGKQQVGLHIRQQRARCRIPDRIRHVLHQFRQRQLYNFTPLSRLTDHQTDQTRALHKALQTRGRLMNIERHVARPTNHVANMVAITSL